jgi:AraC-like DNA-binding protein
MSKRSPRRALNSSRVRVGIDRSEAAPSRCSRHYRVPVRKMPRLWARAIACARFSTESLPKIFLTCDLTVSGVMPSAFAISLFERPSVISTRMPRSRWLSGSAIAGEGMPLARLAAECGLSVRHFARAFRQSTGVPPHRWLLRRRVERAAELLGNRALPLADIAIACGFADQSHFTRVFTALMGASPNTWRRTIGATEELIDSARSVR